MSNDLVSRVINGYARAVRAFAAGFETVTVVMKRTGTVITSQSARPIDQRSPIEEKSVKMTLELLQELGSCGDYTRVFRRQFPTETYPDGVEVNAENCTANADRFPWSWARETMLNPDGYRKYQELYDARITQYNTLSSDYNAEIEKFKDKHNLYYSSDATGDARAELNELTAAHNAKLAEAGFPDVNVDHYNWTQAAVFGEVFDQHPELRSPNILAAQERAIERKEREVLRQYEAVVNDINYAKGEIERLSQQLPDFEAREAELRAQVLPAKARQAAAKAELAAERLAEAQAAAERAQVTANEAKSEADRLAAEAAQITTGDANDGNAEAETESAAATA